MAKILRKFSYVTAICATLAGMSVLTEQSRCTFADVPKASTEPSTAVRDENPLIHDGKAALAAGRYKEARDLFQKEIAADPKDYVAMHGAGIACLYLHDSTQANKLLEQAVAISPVADRALSYNFAVSDVNLSNYRRAAQTLMDYLYANPDSIDEPLVNALGVCLNQTSNNATVSKLSDQTQKFYSVYVAKLEEKRPGMKRWGTKWLSAADVDDRANRMRQMETDLDLLAKDLAECKTRVDQYKQELQTAKYGHGVKSAKDAQWQLNNEEKSLVDKQQKYDRAAAEIDAIRPEYPQLLLPISMNETTPPPSAEIAAAPAPAQASAPSSPANPSPPNQSGGQGPSSSPKQADTITASNAVQPPVTASNNAQAPVASSAVAAADTTREITIDAKEGVQSTHVSLGLIRKGQSISFQYLRGKWTAFPRSDYPPASPDDVPLAHSNVLPLRFCEHTGGSVVELGTVAGGTKTKPFIYVADHDIADLVLNQNDNHPNNNVGAVTYQIIVSGP